MHVTAAVAAAAAVCYHERDLLSMAAAIPMLATASHFSAYVFFSLEFPEHTEVLHTAPSSILIRVLNTFTKFNCISFMQSAQRPATPRIYVDLDNGRLAYFTILCKWYSDRSFSFMKS